jgi:hypothetical protein
MSDHIEREWKHYRDESRLFLSPVDERESLRAFYTGVAAGIELAAKVAAEPAMLDELSEEIHAFARRVTAGRA